MSNRIRIRAEVRLKDELFSPGMLLRAHLPLPAACEQQSEIVIEKISSGGIIAPEDAPQRTVCWEGEWWENPRFSVVYSYVHTAKYHDLSKPGALPPLSGKALAPFLAEEAPHIVFTPYLRALAEELTKGMDSPLEKAGSIYDFITLNMKYTFMPAYFGLENIAVTCAAAHGAVLPPQLHRRLRGICPAVYHPVPVCRRPRPVAERPDRRARFLRWPRLGPILRP